MTKWILRLAAIACLVMAGVWAWRTLFPSPEQVIRKRLAHLAETASTTGKEGTLAKASRVQSLANFFTPDVEISIDVPGQYNHEISGREELVGLAMASRSMGQPIRVELVDINVTVEPGETSAEAHLAGTAVIPGERTVQIQELRAHLRKIDGQWLIDRAETVRTLR